MKRQVTITLYIDPTEYNEAEDTPSGCIDLVIACLRNEADWPNEVDPKEPVTICCERVTRKTKDHL